MDENSPTSEGCAERTAGEGKPRQSGGEAKVATESTASSSEQPCIETEAVTASTATSAEQPCTMNRCPAQENIAGGKHQEAVKDDTCTTTESKYPPSSSDQVRSDPGMGSSETTLEIPKTAEDCALPGQDLDSCEERTSTKLRPPSEITKGDKNTSQGLSVEESCQSPDTQQSPKDQAQTRDLVPTNAELGLPTKLSEGNVQTVEGTDQTTSGEITTKLTQAPPKDESCGIKDETSTKCTNALEHPKSNLSSIRSSSQSAKTCPSPEDTSQGQCNKQDSAQSLPTSSNPSLPLSETMQNDSKCSTKVEDTVNNNVQKCTTSCQEPHEGMKVVQCEAIVSPEKPTVTDQPDCPTVKVQKVADESSPFVTETVEAVGNTQNRSLLMKYLGLQPVQEGGKTCSKDARVDVASLKPRLGVPYLDSFSTMPGLDLMNCYEKGHISYNTSPFEVCSDGSHSPEPPLLAETPVVGSSPPHHDYDAMEARMMDMTPRVDSVMGRGDLLSSFPHSHPPSHDTKTAFNRKQHGASGYTSSHALDSLCHRLAERVEPDIPDQDHTVSQGSKLNETFYSIPDMNQKDHDRYGSKTEKFSSMSEVVPCPRCHRTFKNRNQLRGHLRWHINDPINLLSGRWPKDRASSHEKDLTTGKSSGKVLDKFGTDKKKTKLKAHLDTEKQGSLSHLTGGTQDAYPCTLCTKVFRTSLKLRGHMMVHKRKQPKKKNIYWRNKTNKGSGSSGRGGKFKCEICSEKYESQLKLSTHMTTHAKEVHPRSKGVKRLGSLASNNSESSSVGNGPNMRQKAVLGKRKAPFKCDICFKTFLTLRARNGHKGIHSSKWKLANSRHHLGRPVKIKEEPSSLSPTIEEQFPSETVARESDQTEPTSKDESEQMDEANANPGASLNHRKRNTYFKCIHCHLVFASRHRVRKHLFKIHSIVPPGSESFTEEKVDGCKFCEVFKKRKRGRPKRGENTLIKCPHGKVVVGYNLPLNSVRLSRKIRCTPQRVKTEEITAVSPEDVLQQICTVKLSPVDVNVAREIRDISKDNSKDQVQTSEDPKVAVFPVVKKRGRPPKNCLKPANTMQNARKMVFSTNSRRGGTRALSAIRRRRMGNELSLLGRQLKSGWDPKRQRFIGRPYKCHLCKMSYRSERQLCSHMRSHGIHIFDLSQLPADQRGNAFMSSEDMETKSDDGQDLDSHEAVMSTKLLEGITATPSETDLDRTDGESGVGGTCAVCKKEFDSDNMFHQHLLGRYNKKCRQEWMNHTFGFGMRNKVKDASEQEIVGERNPVDPQNEQSNGNLYVIDKINMEGLQGSGIFSNLQQKVNDKIENVLQIEKLANNSSRSLENTENKDTEQPPHVSTQDDAGLTTNVSPKKGSVLNAVINRLTQSSKPSNDNPSTLPASSQSSKPGKKPRKGSDRPVFKCHICNKAFDKKQKLSVHAMIHRPKVATVMDHVEIATQRSGSGISTLPSGGGKQKSLQDQVINDCLGTTAPDPVAPMHLIYSCTECPKQFTSNLKLASHIKMHMKSTMSRNPKRDTSLVFKPQDVKREQALNTNKTDAPASLMDISSTPVFKTDVGNDDTPNRGMPSASKNEVQDKDKVTSDGNSCDSTEPTTSSEILKPGEIIQDVPIEQDVKKDGERSYTESEQISTSRPRLLLKINPATLQRLYDCQECFKSFKSRRQLAHHQKIHAEEKVSPGRLEGDDMEQSDSNTTFSTVSEDSQPDCSKHVSHSYESEERTASDEPCPQDPDQSSVEAVNQEPQKHTNVNIKDISVHAKQSNEVRPSEKIVPCKICDKVMKKSQLGGHMKSHTKELLSRKFTRPEHGNVIDKQQFDDRAPSKSIMNKEIISGVDLYRSVSRKAESTLEYPLTEAVNGIAATDNEETARDTEFGAAMNDIYDYEEEIQDEDSGKQQFTCQICNTKYDFYQQLCQHLKMHVVKNPNFTESAAPSDINGAPLSDEIDDKPALHMENVEPTFARPKVYPCELCGFSFASFRQFRVHISQTHGGKYQYRLMIQQKEAAKAGAFLKEPDTINKTHPHKCDVCGRRFKRLALLIFHLNKLHKGWKQRLCMMNVRSRPRPPNTAEQKMSGANGPSTPGATGVDPADLPFTCELCGKSFRMKVQLCGHMKTHGRVGHSPIKITPLSMKGKYTLRKSRKPDFRLSDEWILDMDDERMAFENSMALQQLPPRPTMIEQPNKMKGSPDANMYASMYAAKPIASNMAGTQKIIPGLAEHTDHYRMPMSSPELPMTPPALDLKIPVAPTPPEPSKFITIQMEPVLQQMLHRCLLCHSYFSSQASAVLHCKEVHFKKRPKALSLVDAVQSPAHPLGQNYQMSGAASGVRPHSALHSSVVSPARTQVSPSLRPPVPQRMHCTPSMVAQVSPGIRSPTSQSVPSIKSPGFDRVSLPPSRFPVGSRQTPVLPYAGPMPKAAPTPSPSAKTISQTPFNEMLYRVETSEGQTRYVCNTCKSTFLHYNFLMSHLADHNHLAYTCLQCGYATYSEKDYQLHCQLHDGQISKKIRRVRPKPPGFPSNSDDKGVAPRAVATCHICQRSFVNMKGLKAHMVLHSANYSSISERRNESKRVQKRSIMVPVTYFNEVASEPLSLVKPTEEQTEALDLTVKPVVDSSVDEVLDLSMGPRNFTDRVEGPLLDGSLDIKSIPEESQAVSLPDVCQVMQQLDIPEEPTSSPTPPPAGKLTHVRKPKNSIRLVGAIDVDVASLENKYSVVTDLLDTDSDMSPDVPLIPGQESATRSGEGESEHDGKSPKKTRNYKCTMCQYATDFKDSMERHEMKHRKFRTLACHQCSYRTPEKRLMLRHVLTIHEKQKPYECKLCSYSSAYKHHLKRHHTKRHQQPLLTCSLCEFTSDDVIKMKDHSASHPVPKVYQCKLCPMVFNSSKLFKAHKQIVHHKKKKSKKSSRDKSHSSSGVTDSSESMGGKETEGVANLEPQEPVVLKHPCNLCKYQTDDQNELTIHLMKKHFSSQIKEGLGDVCSTAQCPQCGYLTGKEQMKAHMQIHDSGELFNCEQCLFKACSQEEVDDHVQQKHKVKLAPTQMCKMCGMHFWNAEDMKQHTEMHLKDTSISVKNPFLCNMCPLKLMNRRDALRHLQLHTDRYPFKCSHCVFSCFTKASIQRHLAIHRHSNSKPKSLAAIRKNGRKSHSMGASGSSGSESDAQKSQRNSQSSKSSKFGPVANRLPIYQCQFCSHNFRVAEDWQRHERRHHMIWPE